MSKWAAYRARLRAKAFDLLGRTCTVCGFNDERALQIDHINGNGNVERKKQHSTSETYKRVIAANGEGYQVLCANCNWIKRHTNNEQY